MVDIFIYTEGFTCMWVFSALFRGGRTIATSMYGLAIRNTVVFISSKFMKIMHKNENNLITQGSFRKYYRKCHFLFYKIL